MDDGAVNVTVSAVELGDTDSVVVVTVVVMVVVVVDDSLSAVVVADGMGGEDSD